MPGGSASPICLLLLTLACARAQDVLPPQVIQQRLERVTDKPAARKEALESLFQEAGCAGERMSEQPVPRSKLPNVVCTLPGQDENSGEIVVGGHIDLVDAGIGVVDDWSGAALLPSLYQSLKGQPRRHRFVFIGFAAEERGLLGSTWYVRSLPAAEKHRVRAMINLECLGTGPPKVWASRADKRLLGAYAKVASGLQIQTGASNVDNVGDDDSHPFLSAHIPVLTIHSITSETLPILHSPRDNLKAIRPGDYYTTYRLAAAYLAFLDSSLE